jgi:hypothetical protein
LLECWPAFYHARWQICNPYFNSPAWPAPPPLRLSDWLTGGAKIQFFSLMQHITALPPPRRELFRYITNAFQQHINYALAEYLL